MKSESLHCDFSEKLRMLLCEGKKNKYAFRGGEEELVSAVRSTRGRKFCSIRVGTSVTNEVEWT